MTCLLPTELIPYSSFFFFFNDTATTEIYTLSLHDALPIFMAVACWAIAGFPPFSGFFSKDEILWSAFNNANTVIPDRKSTRLNSSHSQISYAVFCLKKKNKP